MPFNGAEYVNNQFTTPCCLLPRNINLDELKADHLADKENKSCEACYSLERKGIVSDRIIKNILLDRKVDIDIRNIFSSYSLSEDRKKIIKLFNSSTCNLTCVTCGPSASSAWAKMCGVKLHTVGKNTFTEYNINQWVALSLVGGEPFLEKSYIDLLEQVAIYSPDCFVSVVTNGTIINDRIIQVLEKLNDVNICISIDGIEKEFEYMRFPAKWDIVFQNINTFKQLTNMVSVSYTISNLNVLSHKKTIDWFNSMGLPYNHNIVNNPLLFSPSNIPQHIRDLSPDLLNFTNSQPFDENLFSQFKQEVEKQDRLKGILIQDYMPEVYQALWE